MKKLFYTFILVAGVFLGLALFARGASIFDITYPIAELGGCASQQECKVYCDDLASKDACLAFAEKFGLVAKEKVEQAKKLPALGPGGCQSAEECKAYCDNPDNEEICLAFAEKYGMKVEGARGQEVSARARLIKEQGGPGNCQSQKECRAYCETPANQKECIDFAEKHNLIDKKELKAAKKVMEQGGPGGCKTEKECKAFCDQPENLEACLAFAEEHDLIDKEEAAKARRMAGKPGPGGCVGQACKEYCDGPDHFEECITFAEENNLMPKEELEKAKRLGNKPGPGGCRDHKECDAFCGSPDNQEICFQFAVDNDLIPREEIERIKKMKETMKEGGPGGCRGPQECRAFCENPENQEKCFEFAKENHLVGEKEMKMMERGKEMMKKTREAGGPGGCQGPEECRVFCEKPENVERCLAFAVEQGGMDVEEAKGMLENFAQAGLLARVGGMGGPGEDFRRMGNMPQGMMPSPIGGFATSSDEHFKRFEQFRELEGQFRKPPEVMRDFQGPGGCRGPEECIKYCSDPAHRAECAKFNPSAGAPPPGEMFRRVEPGSEGDFRKYQNIPIGILQKCIEEGGTIEKSESSEIPRCFKKDGEEVKLMPDDMMQNTGGSRMPPADMMPFGGFGGAASSSQPRGEVCTQEYRPVCGANNRTYPNECFAKRDNVSVAKEGPCEAMERNFNPPPAGYPTDGYRPPINQYPQQYTQPPLNQQLPPPPQSRRMTGSLLSNLLQAFSRALMMK